MRVNIDEIKEAGLGRSWDVTQAQLDEMLAGDRAGYRARGPAHVAARLEKLGRRVRVEAETTAALTAACKRCLAPVSVDVPVALDLTLVPADGRADDDALAEPNDHDKAQKGGSFSADDAEEETYTGKVIDLDPIVREQLLLELPEYPVCDEKCKGLCPVCGANLNDRECGCDRHVPDPRWAGLKNVKL
ncbi:MAG TPA: DUF177 domain-containing protein [Anaeromyxobacter sp.]